ncbi:hypothetical protein RvY_13287 [Ramazzottius varieornatus]|uniref:Ubiquitin-like protease family profile domain-containing protein n=1 Tax=Ramazzottius varieornatus TaxID=947166 RepID=A0A1D1VP76_RAMVA|nr:hypothetical protein RvY_13287 [Ramazzottius varieornatus]
MEVAKTDGRPQHLLVGLPPPPSARFCPSCNAQSAGLRTTTQTTTARRLDTHLVIRDSLKKRIRVLRRAEPRYVTNAGSKVRLGAFVLDSHAVQRKVQVKDQLWLLYGWKLHEDEDLTCSYVSVQHQQNGFDCGFFAFACVYGIIDGRDPGTASFSGKTLRKRFYDSSNNKKIEKLSRRRGSPGTRVGYQSAVTMTKDLTVLWQAQRTGTTHDPEDRAIDETLVTEI